jgi:hypothetical protein
MGRVRAAGAMRQRMHISAPPAARPFGDRGPQAGREELLDSERELRVVACTSQHRLPRDHFGIAGCEQAGRSCATRGGPTRLRMPISAPPAAGPGARGPWAASGPEELRDSDWSHGCRRDAVTVCLQYLVSQVTVSDVSHESTISLNWLDTIQNRTLRFESCCSNCGLEY